MFTLACCVYFGVLRVAYAFTLACCDYCMMYAMHVNISVFRTIWQLICACSG